MKKILLIFIIFVCLLFSSSDYVFATINFSIANPVINQDQIEVDVNFVDATDTSCPNQTCYLQGLIKASSSTRYFGFTKNNTDQWIDYISSPDSIFVQNNFFKVQLNSGSSSGKLMMKFNSDDVDYKGPGNYDLKVKRYTGNSSSGSDSNILNVQFNVVLPTPSPTPTPTSTPNPTATPTPVSTPTKTPIASPKPTVKAGTPTPTASPESEILGESTILSTPTPSANPKVSESNNKYPILAFVLIGTGIIFVSLAGFLAYKIRYDIQQD